MTRKDWRGSALGMAPAEVPASPMNNSSLLECKRTFLNELRVAREPLASVGLTAARYELLRLLSRCPDGASSVAGTVQSELRRMLGVTAPVVSRMLGALEQSGLVERAPFEPDGRKRMVRLTAEGLRRVQLGSKALRTTSAVATGRGPPRARDPAQARG
jgi:DNA-binding MarR family transcriptional regulator